MSPILAPNTLDFISHSEKQTRRLGTRLAAMLQPGDVVALIGDLGSGKTRWIQGVCRGLDVVDPVISPTFTLVNEYQGRLPVYHIDLYRLSEASESLTFGLEEYLYGDGISLVEWADKALDYFPEHFLTVELYYLEDTKRRIVMRPNGERFTTMLKEFKLAAFAQ